MILLYIRFGCLSISLGEIGYFIFMLLNELISYKLETLRKQKNLGVYTLCNRAAISYETYRSIRKNKNKDIYLRTLLILLQVLGVTPSEFFADLAFTDENLIIDFK